MRVLKYGIVLGLTKAVLLPKGAYVVDVAMQGDMAFIWALVDPTCLLLVERKFTAYFTGDEIPVNSRHLKTLHCDNGLVWHVFEDV